METSDKRGSKDFDPTKTPDWAIPGKVDVYRNVLCRKCGKLQSPSFKACVYCCIHPILTQADGDWEVECKTCGKNFFKKSELKEYSLVKGSYLYDLKNCLIDAAHSSAYLTKERSMALALSEKLFNSVKMALIGFSVFDTNECTINLEDGNTLEIKLIPKSEPEQAESSLK